MAEHGDYGLILLDVMLPGMSGMELLRRLRRTKQTPVIMVTARDAVMDKVTGLDMGADDYITSPLKSRNCWPASARRCASAPGFGSGGGAAHLWQAHARPRPPHRALWRGGNFPHQPRVRPFAGADGDRSIVLRREQLLSKVWGYDYMGETNVVDVYIRYLRAKVDERFGVKFIHTVRGVGYVFRDAEAMSESRRVTSTARSIQRSWLWRLFSCISGWTYS